MLHAGSNSTQTIGIDIDREVVANIDAYVIYRYFSFSQSIYTDTKRVSIDIAKYRKNIDIYRHAGISSLVHFTPFLAVAVQEIVVIACPRSNECVNVR